MRCSYLRLVETGSPTTENNNHNVAPKHVMSKPKDKKKRSVEMPEELWELIEAEAERTCRSATGVVKAYMMKIYYDADVLAKIAYSRWEIV